MAAKSSEEVLPEQTAETIADVAAVNDDGGLVPEPDSVDRAAIEVTSDPHPTPLDEPIIDPGNSGDREPGTSPPEIAFRPEIGTIFQPEHKPSSAQDALAALVVETDTPSAGQSESIEPSPGDHTEATTRPPATDPVGGQAPIDRQADENRTEDGTTALPAFAKTPPAKPENQTEAPAFGAAPPLVTAAAGAVSRKGGDGVGRLYRVQLAAVNNETAAQIYWRELNERLPDVFADVEPIFDRRKVEERLYLRIWVGAFNSLNEAVNYCSRLKTQGQDCFVTRVDNL